MQEGEEDFPFHQYSFSSIPPLNTSCRMAEQDNWSVIGKMLKNNDFVHLSKDLWAKNRDGLTVLDCCGPKTYPNLYKFLAQLSLKCCPGCFRPTDLKFLGTVPIAKRAMRKCKTCCLYYCLYCIHKHEGNRGKYFIYFIMLSENSS